MVYGSMGFQVLYGSGKETSEQYEKHHHYWNTGFQIIIKIVVSCQLPNYLITEDLEFCNLGFV